MTLYHHHEPAGVCGVCDDHIKALTEHNDGQYMRLTTAERMAIWQHTQTCEVARTRLAQAHAQLALPRLYARLLVRMALAGVATARSVEVIPAMAEEAIGG